MVQDAVSAAAPQTKGQKPRGVSRIVSILMGWGMEDGIERSSAMRARGYDCGARRTTYKRYRFTAADTAVVVAVGVFALVNAVLVYTACSQYQFYPTASVLVAWWGSIPYALMMLIPVVLCLRSGGCDIVEVNGFWFAYPADGADVAARWASRIDEVSFQVEEGDFCLLVGSTGSGKTTLLRSLKPELMPEGERAGSITVAGKKIIENGEVVSPKDPRDLPLGSPPPPSGSSCKAPRRRSCATPCGVKFAFGLENLGIEQDEMRRRVAEVAHFLGIGPWVRSSVEALWAVEAAGQPGGGLALRPRAAARRADLQLDPNALKQFLFMLARVNRELGVTIVMATHAPRTSRRTRRAPSPWARSAMRRRAAGGGRASSALEELGGGGGVEALDARRPRLLRARAGGDVPLREERAVGSARRRSAGAAGQRSRARRRQRLRQDHAAQAHGEGGLPATRQGGKRSRIGAGPSSPRPQDVVRVRQRGGGAGRMARALRLHP